MNKENEKKWFIYMMDHHEGPFSLLELREMKKTGKINAESFSWSEGMADWLPISQVKNLHDSLFKVVESKPQKAEEKKKKEEPSSSNSTNKSKARTFLTLSLGVFFTLFVLLIGLSRFAGEDLHSKIRPLLTTLTDMAPPLTSVFNLVPSMNDVRPEELEELEAARASSASSEARIAIALSIHDPNRPFFYVSTNLPDETKFEVILVGNPETLLNRLHYTSQATVTTHRGFGKTEVFMAEGGQPIPKGEYQVFVVESNDQEERVRRALNQIQGVRASIKTPQAVPANTHFLLGKIYFLGGEKNETYLTRLKSFHEKVKQNAEHEILELKQYTDTLSLQFNTLTHGFRPILNSSKPSPKAKLAWKKDAETWTRINSQLDQTIQTWSEETLQNEFFYGKVYARVKSAYTSIKELFILENAYIENPRDKNSFEIEHGKATSEARESLEMLKRKMDLVLKAPKTQSGLPTREGL